MLFLVKRHLVPTIVTAICFVACGLGLRHVLGLNWSFQFGSSHALKLLIGALVVASSDGICHLTMSFLIRTKYQQCYRALVDLFAVQRVPEMIGGGVLAAAEELIFRGILLQGLMQIGGWAPWSAIAVSSLAFGLAHAIPRHQLWPFTAWAIWEGVLLGGVYYMSGSLAVSCILHACHDTLGFALFRYQKQTGWLL